MFYFSCALICVLACTFSVNPPTLRTPFTGRHGGRRRPRQGVHQGRRRGPATQPGVCAPGLASGFGIEAEGERASHPPGGGLNLKRCHSWNCREQFARGNEWEQLVLNFWDARVLHPPWSRLHLPFHAYALCFVSCFAEFF